MGRKSRERREKMALFLNHQQHEMLKKSFGFVEVARNITEDTRLSEVKRYHAWEAIFNIIPLKAPDMWQLAWFDPYEDNLLEVLRSYGCVMSPLYIDGDKYTDLLIDLTSPSGVLLNHGDSAGCYAYAAAKVHQVDNDATYSLLVEMWISDGDTIGYCGHWWIDLKKETGEVLSVRQDGNPSVDGCSEREVRHFVCCVLKALSLSNSSNVELVDSPPDPELNRQYQEWCGESLATYKTLVIKPNEKRYSRDDKPQERFDVMPLHFRRAHTATYTEDKPLFGRFTGTFPRKASLVGNEKNGTVFKDYELSTLNDEPDTDTRPMDAASITEALRKSK